MKAVVDLIIALALLWGAGKLGVGALKKIEGKAKSKIQKGLKPLSPFTGRMTCLTYSNATGELVELKTKACRKKY